MNFLDLLAQYVPVLGPSLAIALAWVWHEFRKARKEDKTDSVERERTYTDRLENRLKEREADIERLSKEIMAIRTSSDVSPEEILKDLIDNDPGISWVKRRVGVRDYRMVRVSLGYAKILLQGSPEQYDGKRDVEMWGADFAGAFTDNDELVYAAQEGQHVVEKLPHGVFTGRKFAMHQSGVDYVVGIGSYEPNSN